MTSPGRHSDKGGGVGQKTEGATEAVTLGAGLVWINECFPISRDEHEHVSVYLLNVPGARIVVDSGSFYHRENIRSRLHDVTDGEGPDALILSHSDYPHAGNVSAFREEWGDIEIVASSGAPEIQGLPYATKCSIGGSMEVRGRKFSFIDPPLADRSHTTWIYDHTSGALFTSDGFGNMHRPGECSWLDSDFPDGIPTEEVYRYHRAALSWLRYVDPPRLEKAIRRILDEFAPAWICPVHGNVIAAADSARYLERLVSSVTRITEEHPVPPR